MLCWTRRFISLLRFGGSTLLPRFQWAPAVGCQRTVNLKCRFAARRSARRAPYSIPPLLSAAKRADMLAAPCKAPQRQHPPRRCGGRGAVFAASISMVILQRWVLADDMVRADRRPQMGHL
jgi:hypothetical protein